MLSKKIKLASHGHYSFCNGITENRCITENQDKENSDWIQALPIQWHLKQIKCFYLPLIRLQTVFAIQHFTFWRQLDGTCTS